VHGGWVLSGRVEWEWEGGKGWFSNSVVAEDSFASSMLPSGGTLESVGHAELFMSSLLVFYRRACNPLGFLLLTSGTDSHQFGIHRVESCTEGLMR